MTDELVPAAHRGRIINGARPEWVMLGADWDGPGVLLLASRTLKAADLDFRARSYEFRDWTEFLTRFRPELTLKVHMDDDYVLVAGPTYADCPRQPPAQLGAGQPGPAPTGDREQMMEER